MISFVLLILEQVYVVDGILVVLKIVEQLSEFSETGLFAL